MIFFGHVGITLLVVYLVFSYLKKDIDYRFVLVGSILPDLIDKPIGRFAFNSIFHNGRLFAHTFVFVVLLTILGVYSYRKYRLSGAGLLAASSFIHLILDQMWNNPGTLFWPFYGWPLSGDQFPPVNSLMAPDYLTSQEYIARIVHTATSDPSAYIPEIVGLAIIAWFAHRYRLYIWDNLKSFILTGRLPWKEKIIAVV